MAVHYSIPSMLQESLTEMVIAAEDCINFRKDPKVWGSEGCYGYPSAILLFAIADSIGSYVIGGSTKRHFNILNHQNYYNLNLSKDVVDTLYKKYRCLLTHNTVMALDVVLDIGSKQSPMYEYKNGKHYLNLLAFLKITRIVVKNFLENSNNIVSNSNQLKEILKS